jgi:hypothetical protein
MAEEWIDAATFDCNIRYRPTGRFFHLAERAANQLQQDGMDADAPCEVTA